MIVEIVVGVEAVFEVEAPPGVWNGAEEEEMVDIITIGRVENEANEVALGAGVGVEVTTEKSIVVSGLDREKEPGGPCLGRDQGQSQGQGQDQDLGRSQIGLEENPIEEETKHRKEWMIALTIIHMGIPMTIRMEETQRIKRTTMINWLPLTMTMITFLFPQTLPVEVRVAKTDPRLRNADAMKDGAVPGRIEAGTAIAIAIVIVTVTATGLEEANERKGDRADANGAGAEEEIVAASPGIDVAEMHLRVEKGISIIIIVAIGVEESTVAALAMIVEIGTVEVDVTRMTTAIGTGTGE